MNSRGILTSLLRSAARGAGTRLGRSGLAELCRNALAELSPGRAGLSDAQLTRVVTRLPNVRTATVSSAQEKLRIDLGFDDGSELLMALVPGTIAFAPGGAKELCFSVEPASAAHDGRARDVVAAIAGEIARALWRPALAGAPHADHAAFVSTENEQLVVDLRNVPDVRWALQQGLRAAIIEAIKPRALEARGGHLALPLSVHLR